MSTINVSYEQLVDVATRIGSQYVMSYINKQEQEPQIFRAIIVADGQQAIYVFDAIDGQKPESFDVDFPLAIMVDDINL